MTGFDGGGHWRAKSLKKRSFFRREKVEEGRVLKFLNSGGFIRSFNQE
jgi:hypothetical protein